MELVMAEEKEEDGTIKVRIPATLSLRDIITFVSLAVSITMAWGVFGTRLTVVEKELINVTKNDDDLKAQMKDMTQRMNQLENRLRDNESNVEDVWRTLRRR